MLLTVVAGKWPVAAVWVFTRGADGQVYAGPKIALPKPKRRPVHYSVVVMYKDPYQFQNYGHAYIAVAQRGVRGCPEGAVSREFVDAVEVHEERMVFQARVLDKTADDEAWVSASPKSQGCTITVEASGCDLWDPTATYKRVALEMITASDALVLRCCVDNGVLPERGFNRNSQLRSVHASIATPGCVGLEEVSDAHISPVMWAEHVAFASVICAARDELSLLFIALGSFGFLKQWCVEKRDNVANIFFGTQDDCEDQGIAILAAFNHIKKNTEPFRHLPGLAGRLACLLDTFTEGYLASMYVDADLASASDTVDPRACSGHSVAVLRQRSGRYLIAEGTCPTYPFEGPPGHTSFVKGATWSSPQPIRLWRYRTVAFVANERESCFVGPSDCVPFRVGVTVEDFLAGKFVLFPLSDNATRTRHDGVFKGFCRPPALDPLDNPNLAAFLATKPLEHYKFPAAMLATSRKIHGGACVLTAKDWREGTVDLEGRNVQYFTFPFGDVVCIKS
jgi:hypothetical protein